MEIRILGPMEVEHDGGPLTITGRKPRALLAVLLRHANEAVSTDVLIDDLWGVEAPETADNTLQVYVSQLRKRLPAGTLRTQHPGYLLQLEDGQLDLHRFERLAGKGRQALAKGDGASASRLLSEALAVWRGPPLADFTFDAFAQPEIARLTELRLAVLEDRIDADLTLGRQDLLVGELERLAAEHPLRERFRAQLMLALYRSGRQVEALEEYRRTRSKLLDDLGIEPSTELQDLERAILQHDPALASTAESRAGAPVREVRKTVTVLCLDLTVSDAAVDPEVATHLSSSAFAAIDRTLEHHHGIVQSRSGGRTTAVFGTPTAHEDDALRAARSALDALGALESDSAGLELRAGIETGPVLAAEDAATRSVIAGAVLDAAARLAQAAPPGEILVGDGVEPLLKDSARLDPVQPARRRHGDRPSWRLRELTSDAAIPRRFDAPLIGRGPELDALLRSFEEAARTGRPRLFTLLGSAGIGKSRLAAEVRKAVADRARVLGGRCLPYGDGIAFWPVKGVIDQLLAEAPGRTLAEVLAGEENAELIAERVAGLVGAAESRVGGSEETFWAVRRLLESLSRERPLVVVFDDCHWAEATFLDLIEYLVESPRTTPLLLVALARPELLDERPEWAGIEPWADSLELEPLSEQETDDLMNNLLGKTPLAERARGRIAQAAEGNPLFIEQMVAMLGEESVDGSLRVPPTIQALLAARLDRVPAEERDLLGAASVVGKEFWGAAIGALSAEEDRAELPLRLRSLEEKHLIGRAKSIFPGESAFRFRHILIRDAAYEALPKARRSELHERYAGWLEEAASDRIIEFEEIIGYHLERAYRYQGELGLPVEADAELPLRAGTRLGSAGRRAHARGDVPGAVNLLGRATSLLPDQLPARLDLLTDLGEALREVGDLEWAASVLDEAVTLAGASGERVLEWRARLGQLRLRTSIEPVATTDEQLMLAEEAVAVFTQLADDRGLARAWAAAARARWIRARSRETEEALRQAIEYAAKADDEGTLAHSTHLYLGAAAFGPIPVTEGIARCEEVLARPLLAPRIRASAFRTLALLKAMQGDLADSRLLLEQDRALLDELGLRLLAAAAVEGYGLVELLAGDSAAAERELRTGLDVLEQMGDQSSISSISALLARAAYESGRLAEALRATEISQAAAAPDDISPQVQWRGPRAKVLARRGRRKRAEDLAREAVALAERTDFTNVHADALVDLAEVLRLRGRSEDGLAMLRNAERLYLDKGNIVSAARTKALTRALGGTPSRQAAARTA